MSRSNNPKYWDNDKSRALRALTMRLSRMNKVRDKIPEATYLEIKRNIQAARDEIYKIPRAEFNEEVREEIFQRHDLIREPYGGR